MQVTRTRRRAQRVAVFVAVAALALAGCSPERREEIAGDIESAINEAQSAAPTELPTGTEEPTTEEPAPTEVETTDEPAPDEPAPTDEPEPTQTDAVETEAQATDEPATAEPEPTEAEPTEAEPTEAEPTDQVTQSEAPVDEAEQQDWLPWLIAALVLLALLALLFGVIGRRRRARQAARARLAERLGDVIGTGRWVYDQGTTEALRLSDPPQLERSWQATRQQLLSLEDDLSRLLVDAEGDPLANALRATTEASAGLRSAMDADVARRVDASSVADPALAQSMRDTVHERRNRFRETLDRLATFR